MPVRSGGAKLSGPAFAYAYALALSALLAACEAGVGSARSESVNIAPIVYERDDRREVYEVADAALRALAERSAVAIVFDDMLPLTGGDVLAGVASLADTEGVCPQEPFADQPSFAVCSGMLVAPDLVLTAGHCARMIPCAHMRLLTGYFYSAHASLAGIRPDDMHRCAEVIDHEHSAPDEPERLDYAWIRLDRDVPHWTYPQPEGLQVRDERDPLGVGEPLIMFGFPAGVPLKVDEGGAVVDPRPMVLDYFLATTDSFHASSGSPIFDRELRLVGVQNRGSPDFTQGSDGCNRTVHQDDAVQTQEAATYAFRALSGLCEAEPSSPLCGPASNGCGVADRRSPPGRMAWLLVLVGLARLHRKHGR